MPIWITPSENTARPVTVRVELPLTVPPLWVKPATVIAEVPVLAEPLFIMAVSVEAGGLPSDIAAHRSNCRYRQARYQSTSRLSGEARLTTNPGAELAHDRTGRLQWCGTERHLVAEGQWPGGNLAVERFFSAVRKCRWEGPSPAPPRRQLRKFARAVRNDSDGRRDSPNFLCCSVYSPTPALDSALRAAWRSAAVARRHLEHGTPSAKR